MSYHVDTGGVRTATAMHYFGYFLKDGGFLARLKVFLSRVHVLPLFWGSVRASQSPIRQANKKQSGNEIINAKEKQKKISNGKNNCVKMSKTQYTIHNGRLLDNRRTDLMGLFHI
ncbi:Hypothetical predicted protein [Paramuricea clavata]|uniref:Uncharacterized protein n=1 Tax=Paramuricea clavata TaxID=317549 RepID=A0A7D9EH01_PARCT|nr:Hypothetical predicted protein [Paramuricea clavata]